MQAYPYPPHARYPADPAVQLPPGYPPNAHYAPPVGYVSSRPGYMPSPSVVSPSQPTYIVHTDDAATKLNDRVRRKCYNCRTTDTSTWRRSSLTPGKVVRSSPYAYAVLVYSHTHSSATSVVSLSARTRAHAQSSCPTSEAPS